MLTAKTWHVDIYLSEHDRETHAEARLRPDGKVSLVGTGVAHRNPSDVDVPEIGDELAVARALSDLGHKLLIAAVDDIESATSAPAHMVE